MVKSLLYWIVALSKLQIQTTSAEDLILRDRTLSKFSLNK